MKNLPAIKRIFDQVTRERRTMAEPDKEALLAILVAADRRFEMDWGQLSGKRTGKLLDAVDELSAFCDLEAMSFPEDYLPPCFLG